MMLIGLLLGALFGFIAACLVIAARRGLWLKVEIDQRVHLDHTTTVLHHHYVDSDVVEIPRPAPHLVTGRVLRQSVTAPHPHPVPRKEIGR